MSSVTDTFVLVGDSDSPTGFTTAEDTAPKVAAAIFDFIYDKSTECEMPVISLNRKDWSDLQSGKVAGSACIWFGWNHAHPDELADHLKAEGFKHITIWTHHEFDGMDGIAPKVVSW